MGLLETFIGLILESGKSAVNLAIYILLPVMVVMMALMHTLEEKGVLTRVALFFAPILDVFGIPGIGVFAILQILLVSFGAPVATFHIMAKDETFSDRQIAATFAATIVMSQANAVFPLGAVGLNLPVVYVSSIIGGITAALITRFFYKKSNDYKPSPVSKKSQKMILSLLFEGGEMGLHVVYKSLPALVLAILLVNVLKKLSVLKIIERITEPVFSFIGVNSVAVIPVITKFLAGGTAMMAVTIDLIEKGLMTSKDLNMLAGFMINPIDPVGIMVFLSVGLRFQQVLKPVLIASLVGIFIRGIIHIVYFY